MKTIRLAPLAGALLLFGTGCSNTRDAATATGDDRTSFEDRPSLNEEVSLDLSATSPSNTVLQNATALGELSMFVAAVERAGLTDELGGAGPVTVFAPINAAFDGADVDMNDVERLREVLLYHVADEALTAGDLTDGMTLVMMNGEEALVGTTTDDELSYNVDDADIIHADVESSNGVIHLINLVLNPTEGGAAGGE